MLESAAQASGSTNHAPINMHANIQFVHVHAHTCVLHATCRATPPVAAMRQLMYDALHVPAELG
jgi:hypothetical protein